MPEPAERELRPLVIARKTSFGSQSDAGARICQILVTVPLTLGKRICDVMTAFKSVLNQFAEQPAVKSAKLLFRLNSS